MFCTTECWSCEDKSCKNYIDKTELYFENQKLKEENNIQKGMIENFVERNEEAISFIRECCNMDSKWTNLHFDYAQNEMSAEQVDELLEKLKGNEK